MSSVPDRNALHAAVQRDLNRASPRLHFVPVLEQLYTQDSATARARHLLRAGALGLVLFDSFQIADVNLIPDRLTASILFHIACTLVYGAVLTATWLGWTGRRREAAHALCFMAALLGSVSLSCISQAPNRSYICVTYVLFVFFVNVVIRLRWRWCLVFSAVAILTTAPAMLFFSACRMASNRWRRSAWSPRRCYRCTRPMRWRRARGGPICSRWTRASAPPSWPRAT